MNQRQCCALLVVGLLAAATCPAQPFPSFILDTNVVIGPSMDHATGTSVAFGPDTGLVVWVEASMLCGVRLDGNGRVLDTLPMDIDGPELEAYDNMQPDVAWGSGRFLVVWTDWDQAMCALVTPGGRVTQRRVLQDSLRPAQNERVSVAFDGDNFLAAWTAYSDELGSVAYFARVSPEGTVLDSPPRRVVPDTSYDQGTVAVGFHGDRYLALWTGFQLDLRGSFVLPDGSITDSSGFLIRTGSTYSSPAVTHDGYHFVACWNERPYMTKVARIRDDGIVLDTSGVCIDSSSLWANDVFSTGETTLVVFCSDPVWGWDSLAVMAVRADTALRRLDSVPVVLSRRENGHGQSAAPGDPSVAVCGRDFLVAWCQPYRAESVASNNNAVFRRVSGQGQPVESVAVTVSYAANHHAYPDLASDGDNHLAVWVDYRRTLTTDSQRLHAMRFSPAGARLDPEPIDLGGYRALRPAVAFGGGCYLVAWHDAGDVYAVRVGSDGRLLDSVAARLNGRESARSYLDVSYCDSMFLVAWETRWTRTDQVRGVRVNPEGRVLDTVTILLQLDVTHDCRYPQVASDGTNFLVTRLDVDARPRQHVAARVSREGRVLDSADIVIGRAGSSSALAKLAFGGGCYLATDGRNGASWRISQEGTVLDSVPVPYYGYASVGFDGTDFMLLCERDSSFELGGLRIAPDGRVLDSAPFLLVSTGSTKNSARYAALATNNSGQVGLVFRSLEPPLAGAGRIRAAAFPAIIGVSDHGGAGSTARLRVWPTVAGEVIHASGGFRRSGSTRVEMYDASGRMRMELRPGPNDVRHLATGVYLVRGHEEASVTKVVLMR